MKKEGKRKSARGKRFLDVANAELRDPEYAREFILASMEEGVELRTALNEVAKAVGWSYFARWVHGMERPNVIQALGINGNPTIKTMNKLLAPMGLRVGAVSAVSLEPTLEKNRQHA